MTCDVIVGLDDGCRGRKPSPSSVRSRPDRSTVIMMLLMKTTIQLGRNWHDYSSANNKQEVRLLPLYGQRHGMNNFLLTEMLMCLFSVYCIVWFVKTDKSENNSLTST